MKTPSQDPAEAIAFFRFSLIGKVQDLLQQPAPLKTVPETVAASSHLGPDGRERRACACTLEDWWHASAKGGFAALRPNTRSDPSGH